MVEEELTPSEERTLRWLVNQEHATLEAHEQYCGQCQQNTPGQVEFTHKISTGETQPTKIVCRLCGTTKWSVVIN